MGSSELGTYLFTFADYVCIRIVRIKVFPSRDAMSNRDKEIRGWFYGIVEKFRQKGAVSPEKAMNAYELGLPERFEDAMKRDLGRTGVFVEVNRKYYLSEERLKQIEQLRPVSQKAMEFRKRITRLRMAQLITAAVFVALFAANIFIQSSELQMLSILFLVIWLAMSIFQIYYVSRLRKRMFSRTQFDIDSLTETENILVSLAFFLSFRGIKQTVRFCGIF